MLRVSPPEEEDHLRHQKIIIFREGGEGDIYNVRDSFGGSFVIPEKIVIIEPPKEALLRQGLHQPDQHSTINESIIWLVWQEDPCLLSPTVSNFQNK